MTPCERILNEVEVAPFALRHAGVLLCVLCVGDCRRVSVSTVSLSLSLFSLGSLGLSACDAAAGDVLLDCGTLSSLQCQPKTECMSSVPTLKS